MFLILHAKQHLRVMIKDTVNFRERDYGRRRFHPKSHSRRLLVFNFSHFDGLHDSSAGDSEGFAFSPDSWRLSYFFYVRSGYSENIHLINRIHSFLHNTMDRRFRWLATIRKHSFFGGGLFDPGEFYCGSFKVTP